MDVLRHPVRFLRSRRLAVGLIAAVAVYSVVATLVPQTSASTGGAEYGRWVQAHPLLRPIAQGLGLYSAWSSPLFLAIVALLGLATAACAWERTRSVSRDLRRAGRITDAEVKRLKDRPHLVLPVAPAVAEPLENAAAPLRRLHLRVRRGPRLLEASSGRAGLAGSPFFHWMLALLFVVVAVGRLSRAEGMIGVPVGFTRIDTADSYGNHHVGPLYPGHSGLTLSVTDLRPFKDAEGVDRGISPYVELLDGKTLLREQRVYPNNPLRYGALLIHSSGYGLAPVLSVESTDGAEILQSEPLVDFDEKKPGGTAPALLDLLGSDGEPIDTLNVSIPLDTENGKPLQVMPREPRVALDVRFGSVETSTVLPKGGSMKLPSGETLRVKDVVYYARLSVADDWSVYPIYLLFVLAATAMSVAVVVPYRTVHVLLVSGTDGRELHAVMRHRRGDPLFAERVEAALRSAAAGRASEKEESA